MLQGLINFPLGVHGKAVGCSQSLRRAILRRARDAFLFTFDLCEANITVFAATRIMNVVSKQEAPAAVLECVMECVVECDGVWWSVCFSVCSLMCALVCLLQWWSVRWYLLWSVVA